MFDVPVYTSPKQLDCGATSLKMLLAYYGIEVDLETLDREIGTRITGCTMADINRVAKLHGLEMQGYDYGGDIWELFESDRPAIIWWHFSHFVVFCGMNDEGLPVINNPDSGRYHVPVDTFRTLFSGKVTMKKDEE